MRPFFVVLMFVANAYKWCSGLGRMFQALFLDAALLPSSAGCRPHLLENVVEACTCHVVGCKLEHPFCKNICSNKSSVATVRYYGVFKTVTRLR